MVAVVVEPSLPAVVAVEEAEEEVAAAAELVLDLEPINRQDRRKLTRPQWLQWPRLPLHYDADRQRLGALS